MGSRTLRERAHAALDAAMAAHGAEQHRLLNEAVRLERLAKAEQEAKLGMPKKTQP